MPRSFSGRWLIPRVQIIEILQIFLNSVSTLTEICGNSKLWSRVLLWFFLWVIWRKTSKSNRGRTLGAYLLCEQEPSSASLLLWWRDENRSEKVEICEFYKPSRAASSGRLFLLVKRKWKLRYIRLEATSDVRSQDVRIVLTSDEHVRSICDSYYGLWGIQRCRMIRKKVTGIH